MNKASGSRFMKTAKHLFKGSLGRRPEGAGQPLMLTFAISEVVLECEPGPREVAGIVNWLFASRF